MEKKELKLVEVVQIVCTGSLLPRKFKFYGRNKDFSKFNVKISGVFASEEQKQRIIELYPEYILDIKNIGTSSRKYDGVRIYLNNRVQNIPKISSEGIVQVGKLFNGISYERETHAIKKLKPVPERRLEHQVAILNGRLKAEKKKNKRLKKEIKGYLHKIREDINYQNRPNTYNYSKFEMEHRISKITYKIGELLKSI